MAVWPGHKMKYLVVHPTEVIIVVITRVADAAAYVIVVVLLNCIRSSHSIGGASHSENRQWIASKNLQFTE